MNVWVLIHNDAGYDTYIRGVYATEAAAQAAIPEKEMRHGLYQSGGHDKYCCAIEEWPVHAIPLTDPPHGD